LKKKKEKTRRLRDNCRCIAIIKEKRVNFELERIEGKRERGEASDLGSQGLERKRFLSWPELV